MNNVSNAEKAEFLELLQARESIYTFLSAAYYKEVTPEYLSVLQENPLELEGELKVFADSLRDADLEQTRVDLATEFARIFLGMSASPVAPYESVYTSETRLLMQDARDDVVIQYGKDGFVVSSDASLPEDHVAFELEFMMHLCRKTKAAVVEVNDEDCEYLMSRQREFFESHLSNWLPALCEDVRTRAQTAFYRGVVELTESFVASERDFFRSTD